MSADKSKNFKHLPLAAVGAILLLGANFAFADTTKTTVKTSVKTSAQTLVKTTARQTDTLPKVSSGDASKGKILFEKMTCAGCHPAGGNVLHPYRPLKGPQFLARYKEDKQIEALIRTGVPRAGMPSFSKAQLNDAQVKDLISYVRTFTPDAKK
jgi:mono/diheme cytochrome c family protein